MLINTKQVKIKITIEACGFVLTKQTVQVKQSLIIANKVVYL